METGSTFCNRYFEGFWFSSTWSAPYENCDFGRGFEGSRMGNGSLFGRTQRPRIGGQLSEEVRVKSGVPQGSLLGPLLFRWWLYIKNIDNEDIENLQKDLDRSGRQKMRWKINQIKCKLVRFTRDRVNYTLGDQLIPEASSSKYLGIILRSDLNWADLVNYTVKRPGKHYF